MLCANWTLYDMETQYLEHEQLEKALAENNVNLLCNIANQFDTRTLSFEPAPWEAKLLSLITEHYSEDVVALKTLYAVDLGDLLCNKGYDDIALFFYKIADELGYVHGALHVGNYERAAKVYRHLFESRYDGLDYIPYPTKEVRQHLNTADSLFYDGKVKESCEAYKQAVEILNDADAVICVHEEEANKPLFIRKSGIQEVGADYVKVENGLPVGISEGKTCLTYDEICNPNNDDDNHEYRDYFITETEDEVEELIAMQRELKENLSRWQSYLSNPMLMKESVAKTAYVPLKEIRSITAVDDTIVGETTKGKYLFYIDGSGYMHNVLLSK